LPVRYEARFPGVGSWPSSRSLAVTFSCSRNQVELMYSALLLRTARRGATASHSPLLTRSFSAKMGPSPPKSTAHSTTSPSSDDTHPHTPPPSSSQSAFTGTPDVSKSGSPTTPNTVQSTSLSLDFAPPEPGVERERTGAKSSKDSLSSIERRRRQLGRVSFGLFAIGLLSGCIYLGREWTEDELVSRKTVRVFSSTRVVLCATDLTYVQRGEAIPDSRWGRTTSRFSSMFDV
jgi:mitochondrial import inner membrane translocase subunit TIM50